MHRLSNSILRALLFIVLTVALFGCAASLLFSLTNLLHLPQTEGDTYFTTLQYLLLHTPEALTFVPVLLLFLGVCLGKSNGDRLRALYTASLIVTLLLAIAEMLTDFSANGVPDGMTALRNSLIFLPLLLLTADALFDCLVLARLSAPVQLALCVLQLIRLFPTHTDNFLLMAACLNESIRLLYILAVTMLLFGHRIHTGRTVRKKIQRLETVLTEAKEQYEAGTLIEEEYNAKKAQVLNIL